MPGVMPRVTSAHPPSTASTQPDPSLPPLCWRHIIKGLDPYSFQQLRLASRLFCSLCKAMSDSTLTQLSLDNLKSVDTADLAAKGPAASCLCITPPQRPVALSKLNHRQRCEQRLAVFLDNLPPCNIQALDISTAVHHISCSTLQLLVDSLPHLHQLSLCPVATCGHTETDVLCMLQQLPELHACDLDCSLFSLPQSSCSSLQDGHTLVQQSQMLNYSSQQQHLLLHHMYQHNVLPAQQQAGHGLVDQQDGGTIETSSPVGINQQCQGMMGVTAQEAAAFSNAATPAGCSAAASTPTETSSACAGHVCPCACAAPWVGLSCLSSIQHLRLQHLQPGCVRAALKAVAQMPGLLSLSLTGLSQASASLVLGPCPPSTRSEGAAEAATADGGAPAGEEGEARWLLAGLQDVVGLTRLELGVNHTSHSTSSTGALVVPAHTGAPAGYPGASGLLSCSWACIQQLQELVLHGICLDSNVFAATLACQQLTSLFVGGLDLQHDAHAASGLVLACSEGLCSLQVLQVEQHFDLGSHSAAALFPALTSLKVTHAGPYRPDLRCLEHHPHLASLDVASAAGPAGCWSLKDLQLGHLVHLEGLQELRLAEGGDSGERRHNSPGSGGGSRASCSPYRAAAGCGKSGSHWLPCTHLSQVTSLELRGPVTDQSLGQLPTQLPCLKRLTVDSSYFASDGGLQKLTHAPQLELLVLRNCSHFTDYGLEVLLMGCSLKVVAVQGCARIDHRACHRIRKACRYGGSQLLWYGCEGAAAAASPDRSSSSSRSHAASHNRHAALSGATRSRGCSGGLSAWQDSSISVPCLSGSAGSEFLQRCWRQEQQQLQQQQGQQQKAQGPATPTDTKRPLSKCALQHHGSHGQVGLVSQSRAASALVAAATAVWMDACPESRLSPGQKLQHSALAGTSNLPTAVGCNSAPRATASSRTSTNLAAVGVSGCLAACQSAGAGATGAASSESSRLRRISGSCLPSVDVDGQRGDNRWGRNRWGGGSSALAH